MDEYSACNTSAFERGKEIGDQLNAQAIID
jgi:hypothetical protein